MGACFCRCKEKENGPIRINCTNQHESRNSHRNSNVSSDSIVSMDDRHFTVFVPSTGGTPWWKSVTPKAVDLLILETLNVIGTLVENEQEPPGVLMKLHNIADQDEGWLQVVQSMVHVIPVEEPLGPAVITLLLDDCPLPNKEAVLKLLKMFNLPQLMSSYEKSKKTIRQQRNICIVLGVLAEKLSGPSSVAILTQTTLSYLIFNLARETEPVVKLFSLIALEKFAQTSENKATIMRSLDKVNGGNPLIELEKLLDSDDLIDRQVGFCAQWCLDNLFLIECREFSYLNVDMSNINAMLNIDDVSEYLKISPDGLEARCDAYSFESVRCTFQVDSGIWYYETTVLSSGVMQIGWATKNSRFLNHEGYGIGDDEYSLAFDGCRQLVWYNASSHSESKGKWQPGDTLGCLLNLHEPVMSFYLNGELVASSSLVFNESSQGFFAAASFMSFQQCRFNFGSQPFKYPPIDIEFQCFNDYGTLRKNERIILPRHLLLQELREMSINEDSCTICFDKMSKIIINPCGHRGICEVCAALLTECPICRGTIIKIEDETY